MNYLEFKNIILNRPLIFSRDLLNRGRDKQAIRNQLERWRVKKLVIRLRRGIYILNAGDRKINPSRAYIANQLYGPSYVSLEYALGHYGLIPERVSDVTSVATRKTTRYTTEMGTFLYQHVKPTSFRGFGAVKDEAGLIYFIAEPEKAIVDFLYLNLDKFRKSEETIFEESYRFQNMETLRRGKVLEYAGIFGNDKLIEIARLLCEHIKKEGGR